MTTGSDKSTYTLESEFEVVRDLGQGGVSLVKEVFLKGQEERVPTACKATPLETLRHLGRTPETEAPRLDRLKKLSASVDNPYALKFFDYRFSDTTLYSFWELATGGDLFDRIVDAPNEHLSEQEAQRVAYGLLKGIERLPTQGVIHRDLKPENILFREGDDISRVIVADWGMCLEGVKKGDVFMGITGSAGYMAPEMAAGLPYDGKVDLWSLGMIIYECLTGRSPYVSQTRDELLRETVEKSIPYPKRYWANISEEAKHFVQCMLVKDPTARWSAAQLLEHPWIIDPSIAERKGAVSIGEALLPSPTDVDGDTQSLESIDQSTSSVSSRTSSVRATKAQKSIGVFGTADLMRVLSGSANK